MILTIAFSPRQDGDRYVMDPHMPTIADDLKEDVFTDIAFAQVGKRFDLFQKLGGSVGPDTIKAQFSAFKPYDDEPTELIELFRSVYGR